MNDVRARNGAAAVVDAAMSRVRDHARQLETRPPAATLDALCEVLEIWRRPDSTYRKELVARLPEISGFDSAMFEAGLDLALEEWTGDALRALVHDELGESTNDKGPLLQRGFATTGVVLAGAIPMPSLLASLLPLVLHSPTLIKPASRDPVTPELVVRSIADVDPVLGACIEVVSFGRDDDAAARAFFQAPCINATGSDETLDQIAEMLGPDPRFIRHGHKTSIAVVGPDVEIADVAPALAIDVALWDQLGCLSATNLFVVGRDAKVRADRLAQAIAAELAACESRWPRGAVTRATGAAIAHERSQVEMRIALGKDVALHASVGTLHTVVLEEEASLRPSPLHRFVRVVPVSSASALCEMLRPIAHHLAAVALAGFGEQTDDIRKRLLELGASRVCDPGRLQAPPLGWPRDNQQLLKPMLRSRS